MHRVTPAHTSCWEMQSLLRDADPTQRAMAATGRLLDLATGLEPRAHLSLVLAGDGQGRVTIRLHTDTRAEDLDDLISWVGEGIGTWRRIPTEQAHLTDPGDLGVLVEVLPSVSAPAAEGRLFLHDPLGSERPAERPPELWPIAILNDGIELLEALAHVQAQVRVHMAPASEVENQMVQSLLRRSIQSQDPIAYSRYLGAPVRIRCFVGQAGRLLSPRLRSALGRLGLGLKLVPRNPAVEEIRAAWDADVLTLSGSVQPFGVAQCLARIPASGERAALIGIPTAEAETTPVPLEAEAYGVQGLRLGSALAADGRRIDVRIAPDELLLHTQILGSTGTGKSTLLAALVQEAVSAGMGVTVLENHGPLVDRILAELPEEAAPRTVVVRSGDTENPVPVNPFRCGDFDLMVEVVISVMRELLDPNNQGFLGPRFERIFAQTVRAQTALFGRRANLTALPLLLRSTHHVQQLATALSDCAPQLATEIDSEFARLTPDDFGELVAWINAKYQRLIGSPEMRAILQTGEDAVDVTRVIDEHALLLVDLASPTVGPLGSQFLGEMWLAKHWAALARRAHPRTPHLLIVDEAHLFASGLLPRLLAEARKFGLGVVLAHQHLEQLTPHLREAALATTSNVVVFRSGPREAATAVTRLGAWAGGALTRLPRFHAASTLSLGNEQSDAFSLLVDHNSRTEKAPRADHIREQITAASIEQYVNPYRATPPIDAAAVDARVDEMVRAVEARGHAMRPSRNLRPPNPRPPRTDFLDEWLARRAQEDEDPT